MKTIATVTSLFSNDIFIKPHFSTIAGVDKRIALIGSRPWSKHSEEHGYVKQRNPEKHLKQFSDVEIKYTNMTIDEGGDMAPFYNQFVDLAQEYDYVCRFDADMIFTDHDWKYMIDFVKNHDFDFYAMNFTDNTTNYYVDFNHGVMNAKERDVMIIKTDRRFTSLVETYGTGYTFQWPGWMCHHFRGWNKPNTPNDFLESDTYKQWASNGEYKAPLAIRRKFDEDLLQSMSISID